MNNITEALDDLKKGKLIIVVDNEDRENEGDLVGIGETLTYDALNFMVKEARGLVCVPITSSRAKDLALDFMVATNTDSHGTAFTVSVDYITTSTGISIDDRLATIKALSNIQSNTQTKIVPSDFKRPGHIFPLVAKNYGVLERQGHTEASVDLARLCGYSTGVICEVLKDDGTMARRDDLDIFAKKHDLKVISIEDLVKYRKLHDRVLTLDDNAVASLPTKFGTFKIAGFKNPIDNSEHVALVYGDVARQKDGVLARLHSECLTGDVFSSKRCDCGDQLELAMKKIVANGSGVILYLRQEGRGIGLYNKIKAYHLQDSKNLDTLDANLALHLPADSRDYFVASQMLKSLGINKIKLMTNNSDKINALQEHGITVTHEAHQVEANSENEGYLQTKKNRMGHMLK